MTASGVSCTGANCTTTALPRSPTIAGSLKKTRPSGSIPTAQPTPALPRRAARTLWAPLNLSTIPTQGVQFHTSSMDYVAQGCTGPKSCECGQTFLNPATGMHVNAVCDVGNGACRPDAGNGTSSGGFAWSMPSSVHLDPSKRYYISVLPGDAGDPFPAYAGQPTCSQRPVRILVISGAATP